MPIGSMIRQLSSKIVQFVGLSLIQVGARLCGLKIEQSCEHTTNRASWATVMATDTDAMLFVCATALSQMPIANAALVPKQTKRQQAQVH